MGLYPSHSILSDLCLVLGLWLDPKGRIGCEDAMTQSYLSIPKVNILLSVRITYSPGARADFGTNLKDDCPN
jgi:hypothetical protein